ncbi:hypothetical protein H3U94_10295 [Bartonella sp. W8125]|uniref:hypothetical protein n=1 Tax=Bartonella TaxID=773 RepID=UPI0018DE6108|nr:hypothetical protein [Bartonella choladocola]MBI0141258.1 hypothetical protein [Bartonella choladocola]
MRSKNLIPENGFQSRKRGEQQAPLATSPVDARFQRAGNVHVLSTGKAHVLSTGKAHVLSNNKVHVL